MSAKSGPAIPNVRGGYKPQSTSNVLTYVLVTISVIVLAALIIGGVVLTANREKDSGLDPNGTVTSGNTDLTVGSATAPVTIDLFEDALCPACGMFEKSQGEEVADAVRGGKLRVRFHMLNFLNESSPSRDYSTRAAAAMQCVAGEKNQELFLKFHSALFQQQPMEGGSSDHSNDDLAKIAREAGANEATQRCIANGTQVDAAAKAAQESVNQLSKAVGGNVSTPSVLLEGKKVDHSNPDWLKNILKDQQ
ncbi:thioredoxin domain-containing protein [Gordonia crocea]|uniref:Membrane protein n=1 Tax=Gordonia crocea TaxID=589162 RepID=A0A7I9V095_9ACTN|nr:thioredoxin domain-containing protein [Gordonia crocea]GED98864.1 membrane protein [Gordonia crocea]